MMLSGYKVSPVPRLIPYFASAWETATATATVMPTIGLLPETIFKIFAYSLALNCS